MIAQIETGWLGSGWPPNWFEILCFPTPRHFSVSHGNRQSSDSTEEWNQAPETRNHGELMVALPKKQTNFNMVLSIVFFFHGDDRLLNMILQPVWWGSNEHNHGGLHSATPKTPCCIFLWDPLLLIKASIRRWELFAIFFVRRKGGFEGLKHGGNCPKCHEIQSSFSMFFQPQYQGIPSILAFVGASTLMGVDRRRPQGKVVHSLLFQKALAALFSGG